MSISINLELKVFCCSCCGFVYGVSHNLKNPKCPSCLEKDRDTKRDKVWKLEDQLLNKQRLITRLKNSNKHLRETQKQNTTTKGQNQ